VHFVEYVREGAKRRQVSDFNDAHRLSGSENVAGRNLKPPGRVE
jgi:hypothetical protein